MKETRPGLFSNVSSENDIKRYFESNFQIFQNYAVDPLR